MQKPAYITPRPLFRRQLRFDRDEYRRWGLLKIRLAFARAREFLRFYNPQNGLFAVLRGLLLLQTEPMR